MFRGYSSRMVLVFVGTVHLFMDSFCAGSHSYIRVVPMECNEFYNAMNFQSCMVANQTWTIHR